MTKAQRRAKKAVAAILDAAELTQGQFAEMIGASLDTVKSWTRKKNPSPVSPQFETRILLATGAEIWGDGSVVTGWRVGSKCGLANKPFTNEAFKFWRTHVAKSDEAVARHYTDLAADSIKRIFTAAIQPVRGQRNKLPAVWQSFSEWLVNTTEDFNLKKQLDSAGTDYFWRFWQRPAQSKPKVKPAKPPRR